MKKLSLIIMMLSLAGFGAHAGATDGGSGNMTGASGAPAAMPAGSTAGDTSAADSRQFLIDAFRDGLSEIRLSQRALQKSSNDQVRNFAQRMINDHTRMNNDIMQLAQRKNIPLPSDLSAEQQAQLDQLEALSGEEFDRAYMAINVDNHEKDVAATKRQIRQGTDPDTRMLAEASLPILEIHLALAEELHGLLDPSAFLVMAYQDGLAEIRLSTLAEQKAANEKVRQFARRMINDHTQANSRITALAQQKGITLPTDLTPAQQTAMEELSRFSGADFDKTYMDLNVVTHLKDVRQARQQAAQGRDPDVKRFAMETLPALVSHLVNALDIDRGIEPSFLYGAYQDGVAEIQLGNLALAQSSNEEVKAFAQQMITDHTAANQQIRDLAQRKNQPLPVGTPPEQLANILDLMRRSGAAFDREYMDINVRNHEKDVALATTQSQDASDPDIRSFARNALPVLTAHLARAREIRERLNMPEKQ